MQEQLLQTTINRSVQLSQAPLNYNGTENTHFEPTTQNISSLEDFFKSHNYSAINWNTCYRKSDNFQHASGFFVDIDEAMKIEEAESILKKQNLNYALITTRTHTTDNHRFRIYIPFSRTVYTYSQYLAIATEINKILDNKCDPAVFDGARMFYGSPKDAYYNSYWDGKDFEIPKDSVVDLSEVASGVWNDTLIVTDSTSKVKSVKEITKKTQILCPFHKDSTSSAFIAYSTDSHNWFIYCSACNKTFWKEKQVVPIKDRCENYWSYGKDILEIGIVGEKFYMENNSEKKVYARAQAFSIEEKEKVFNHLATSKHIPHLKRVDYLGDINVEHSTYNVIADQGLIEVRYAALPVEIDNNKFIEEYLEKTFGKYTTFIKEYLAMYCYTNYLDLPTLILKGVRGCGKNTFAEAIAEIYKPISRMWNGHEGNFNPEVEMKLLIADETLSDDPKQYKTLKKYSGTEHLVANHKYIRQYEVKNNMNMIILSNANTPVFVEKDEQPTDEQNNQFFVYEFHKFEGRIDSEMKQKIVQRLGYYIRTELKTVYNNLSTNGYRYSIKTPITPEEKLLFENNITEVDVAAEKLIDRISEIATGNILGEYKPFVEVGYVPTDVFTNYIMPRTIQKAHLIKYMTDHGYFESSKSEKKMIAPKRLPVYKMTNKLKEAIRQN